MIRSVTLILAVAVATLAFPAHAQLGKLKSLAGGAPAAGTESSAGVPDVAAQDSLVRQFVVSQSHSLEAQSAFAKAFGLAEQVQLLEAERMALSSGSVDVSQMKKSVSVSENAQKAIDERLAAQPELSAESKQHYVHGLGSLLAAALEGRKLSTEATNFANGLKSAGPAQMATLASKLAAGAWVAKESPGYVRGLYGSTKSAMTYARAAKIDVPANADAALDGLK